MPLTAKGEEIHRAMTSEYGSKKGEQVFYASKNAGTISGVDAICDAFPVMDGTPMGGPLLSEVAGGAGAPLNEATEFEAPLRRP